MSSLGNERLKDDLHLIAEDIEHLLQDVGEGAGQQDERLRRRLHAMRERLARLEHEVAYRARKASERAGRYVHDNPWGVVAAAAITSFLVGMLSIRSRHD
jgi:ElaB/YqjD/DUF883 family membrane-anchored ribosome-binding protein